MLSTQLNRSLTWINDEEDPEEQQPALVAILATMEQDFSLRMNSTRGQSNHNQSANSSQQPHRDRHEQRQTDGSGEGVEHVHIPDAADAESRN